MARLSWEGYQTGRAKLATVTDPNIDPELVRVVVEHPFSHFKNGMHKVRKIGPPAPEKIDLSKLERIKITYSPLASVVRERVAEKRSFLCWHGLHFAEALLKDRQGLTVSLKPTSGDRYAFPATEIVDRMNGAEPGLVVLEFQPVRWGSRNATGSSTSSHGRKIPEKRDPSALYCSAFTTSKSPQTSRVAPPRGTCRAGPFYLL